MASLSVFTRLSLGCTPRREHTSPEVTAVPNHELCSPACRATTVCVHRNFVAVLQGVKVKPINLASMRRVPKTAADAAAPAGI